MRLMNRIKRRWPLCLGSVAFTLASLYSSSTFTASPVACKLSPSQVPGKKSMTVLAVIVSKHARAPQLQDDIFLSSATGGTECHPRHLDIATRERNPEQGGHGHLGRRPR